MNHQLLLCLLLTAFRAPFAGEATRPEAGLEKAKALHAEALKKAGEDLREAFRVRIEAAEQKKNEDVLRDLLGEKKAFEGKGCPPLSRPMGTALLAYEKAVKAADDGLFQAFQNAVSEASKKHDSTRVETLSREAKNTAEDRKAEQVKSRTEAIAALLERAQAKHHETAEKVKMNVLAAFDQAIHQVSDRGDFKGVQAYRDAGDAFQSKGVFLGEIPEAVKAARPGYERALEAAGMARVEGFNEAIRQAKGYGLVDRVTAIDADKTAFVDGAGLRLNPRIPRDAALYKGHAYKVILEKAGWEEASRKCQGIGGLLACIGDGEEHQFVFDLARKAIGDVDCWIGLYDTGLKKSKKTNKWAWISGEPLTYSHWSPGQPSNSTDEFYGGIHGNGWDDFSMKFRHAFPYVCEWVNREPEERRK